MVDFSNVTDMMLGNTPVEQVTDSQGNVLWSAAIDPSTVHFYVEDISGAANTLSIVKENTNAPTIEVFYSTDQTNWSSMGSTSTTGITATIPANGRLYLKATANAWGGSGVYNSITASGNHNVGGNIMSLLYGDNFKDKTVFPSGSTSNFQYLFMSDNKLVSAENLVLPATTLASYCYNGMFSGCSSLTTAPALPATTLAGSCYQEMFYGCTSLTTAPALPATTLAGSCYYQMFSSCTSLTTAPELPATTLAEQCYYSMFRGCTSLNSVTTYAQDISATSCLYNWLRNVAATGDFYNLGGATYPRGRNGIPSGWTEHNSL